MKVSAVIIRVSTTPAVAFSMELYFPPSDPHFPSYNMELMMIATQKVCGKKVSQHRLEKNVNCKLLHRGAMCFKNHLY